MSAVPIRWIDGFGFDEHAAALMWLVDSNQVSTEQLVDVIAGGVTETPVADIPGSVLDLMGTRHRPTAISCLIEMGRGANRPRVGELMMRWLATSSLSPRDLASSASGLTRLLGYDHPAYFEFACIDESYEGWMSGSERAGDHLVIESFRRAATACDADEAQLEILRANAVQHPSRVPEPRWKRVFARRTR